MSLRRPLSPKNVSYLQSIGALNLATGYNYSAPTPPPLPKQSRAREAVPPPSHAPRARLLRPKRRSFAKVFLWILVLIAAWVAVGRLSGSPLDSETEPSDGKSGEVIQKPIEDSESVLRETQVEPSHPLNANVPNQSTNPPALDRPEDSSQLSQHANFERPEYGEWIDGWAVVVLLGLVTALGIAGIFEFRKHRGNGRRKWKPVTVISRLESALPITVPVSNSGPLAPTATIPTRNATKLPPTLRTLPLKPWGDPGSWPTSIPVPVPLDALFLLAGDDARDLDYDRFSPWWLGHFSFRGNTRSENQDAALQFELNGARITLIADGLGGAPHGQRASRIAVLASAKAIYARRDASPSTWTSEGFLSAQSAIERQAERLGIDPSVLGGGLQTTLLIVVATLDEVHYRMIGDGGLIHLHADGTVSELVAAQKGDAANQVGGCLGPVRFGLDEAGVTPWQPGDLVVLGTDGAFDVYRSALDFGAALRNSLAKRRNFSGNLPQLAAETVLAISQWVDEQGEPYSDDNITLAVIGTGKAPDYVTGNGSQAIREGGAPPSTERTTIRVA